MQKIYLVIVLFLFSVVLGLRKQEDSVHRFHGRIIGGENASIEDYPYQLSLEYNGYHSCGASIISEDWVLTAAHCVEGISATDLQFRAGSSIRDVGGSLHPASEFISHPEYLLNPSHSDIAVVRVSVPFTYGPGVQPITLATAEPTDGELATVTGWGLTSPEEESLPSQLQVVSVPIVGRQKCSLVYQKIGGIDESMICAGEAGKGVCFRDSGGPLVVGGKLVGTVAFGEGCAVDGYPEVYSNIAVLRNFIITNIGSNL